MPVLSATVYSQSNWPRKDGLSHIGDCIIRTMEFPSEAGGITKVAVTAEEDHLLIDNGRATLREVIKAYWDCDAALVTNNSTGALVQELLDTPIIDFPCSSPTPDATDYTIELCKEDNIKTGTTKKALCIQIASNYRGFIEDVDIVFRNDKVHVSTEMSNFVFPHGATLREIAKTCWHESDPYLFWNKLPAPTSAYDLLDLPVSALSNEEDQLILEIREKGNILYKD